MVERTGIPEVDKYLENKLLPHIRKNLVTQEQLETTLEVVMDLQAELSHTKAELGKAKEDLKVLNNLTRKKLNMLPLTAENYGWEKGEIAKLEVLATQHRKVHANGNEGPDSEKIATLLPGKSKAKINGQLKRMGLFT